MKTLFILLALSIFTTINAFSQAGTEVFLFDLSFENGRYVILNPINISNNPGYDNQPSFSPDGSFILFSATRNNQTDVRKYDVASGTTTWMTNTIGSEYSPIVTPDGANFSAINLKPNGEQLLWKYSIDSSTEPTVIVPDLVIGYHSWFNSDTLVSFVLADSVNPATLQLNDLKNNENKVIAINPGRSIHRIESSGFNNHMSYVSKPVQDQNVSFISSLNMGTLKASGISQSITGSEDMAWTPNGDILMGTGSILYFFTPRSSAGWVVVADLNKFGLTGITRIAVSPNGDKVCIVVSEQD